MFEDFFPLLEVRMCRPIFPHYPSDNLEHGIRDVGVLLHHLGVYRDGRVAEFLPIDLLLIVADALNELVGEVGSD
jgi:hypothetical protein